MTATTSISVGDRVRLHAPSPLLALRSDLGTVVRADERYADLGYWIVELDEPADYIDADGDTRHLTEVVETACNLTVVECVP